jgi:hypothetical protein
MKNTKEWYEVRAQFEKDIKNSEFPGYFVLDLSKDEKGNYNNGQISQMWALYLHGYSLGKSTHQQ